MANFRNPMGMNPRDKKSGERRSLAPGRPGSAVWYILGLLFLLALCSRASAADPTADATAKFLAGLPVNGTPLESHSLDRGWVAHAVDLRIVGRSFDAAIPGTIMTLAIAVLIAVGFVVFVVVTHDIVEREPVVRGDEINAGVGAAAVVLIKIRAAGQSIADFADQSFIAAPETPHRVAKFSVPL